MSQSCIDGTTECFSADVPSATGIVEVIAQGIVVTLGALAHATARAIEWKSDNNGIHFNCLCFIPSQMSVQPNSQVQGILLTFLV